MTLANFLAYFFALVSISLGFFFFFFRQITKSLVDGNYVEKWNVLAELKARKIYHVNLWCSGPIHLWWCGKWWWSRWINITQIKAVDISEGAKITEWRSRRKKKNQHVAQYKAAAGSCHWLSRKSPGESPGIVHVFSDRSIDIIKLKEENRPEGNRKVEKYLFTGSDCVNSAGADGQRWQRGVFSMLENKGGKRSKINKLWEFRKGDYRYKLYMSALNAAH